MTFWWILIGSVVLLGLGAYLMNIDWDGLGFTIALIAGVALLIALVVWPLNYYTDKTNVVTFEITQQTIDDARGKDMSEFERATITKDIVELNQWLISAQYWNEHGFDPCIPNEVMELQPLK